MRYMLMGILVFGLMQAVPAFAAEEPPVLKPLVTEEFNKRMMLSEEQGAWRQDWWKYLIIVLGGLLALFLAIRITKMLLHLVVFGACLAVGGLGSLFLSPYVLPYVNRVMTEDMANKVSPNVIAHSVTFLGSYFLALIIMWMIHRPMKTLKRDIEQ